MAGGHLGSLLVLSGKSERYHFHGLSLVGPGRSEVGLLVELRLVGESPRKKCHQELDGKVSDSDGWS